MTIINGIACCNHTECPKHETCERYLSKDSPHTPPLDFQNICKESNDYKYFWAVKTDIQTTTDT